MAEPARASALAPLAAASPASPRCTLREGPAGAKIALRGGADAAAAAGPAFGLALPAALMASSIAADRSAFKLGPDEWLLVMPGADPAPIIAALEAALAGTRHAVVDVSHRSVLIVVAGPEAASVLNAGCPLDLSLAAFPVGMATRTLLGKADILLARAGEAEFHVDVWRSFAPYAWQFLEEARREFV